ncbi:MAG: BtaA family protein [Patescibacteria group bacterium]|nr:BtaA family protein [Patescibacteria group bacterium]
MAIVDWLSSRVFNLVHQHNLVYNTCWEDPRLDREALELGPDDTVLVITSAGCNALDYALVGPKHVYAVDMNPRQNALLELKLAGIRRLDYKSFFEMFGRGHLPAAQRMYNAQLRPELSEFAQRYWDRRIRFFTNPRRSFFFRGTSGTFAKVMNFYINKVLRLRPWVDAILQAGSVEEQRQIYDERIRDRLWTRSMKFAMNRDTTLSLVGVPKAQRRQVEQQYDGKIANFIRDCLESVLTQIPLSDNYFWRVYMTGEYSTACCPEYLKQENFEKLKGGLVDRVSTHTESVQGFLENNDVAISRFVLLDHMDWLSDQFFPLLEAEWQAIVRRATPDARLIWRSGGMRTEFVDRVRVTIDGQTRSVGEMLQYHHDLADRLHRQCRVHTYGSFYIADLAA